MFLSAEDIQKRLARGDLRIDPQPQEDQLGPFTVALRLGTQLAQFPLPQSRLKRLAFREKWQTGLITVPVGKEYVLSPGSTIVGVTLEYIYLPLDMAGLLYPTSSWERLGLTLGPGTIDPGFQGKVALVLRNVGVTPVAIHPGLRIVRLCLATLSRSLTRQRRSGPSSLKRKIHDPETAREQASPRPTPSAAARPLLARRLSQVLTARGVQRGKALEELTAEMFTSLEGLTVIRRNPRLRAEELDLVIKNDRVAGFWRLAGSPILIECKNWSAKVGAREISVLVDKLRTLGPDAKTGVLITLNGVTGNSYSDAMLKIRETRQAGRYILVLDRNDLENVVAGTPLEKVIEQKYEAILMI